MHIFHMCLRVWLIIAFRRVKIWVMACRMQSVNMKHENCWFCRSPWFIHHSWCRIREAKHLKKLLLGHNITIDDGDDDDEEEEEVVVVAAVVVVAIILTIIIYHSTLQMITNSSTSELDKNPSHPAPIIPSHKSIKRCVFFRAILTVSQILSVAVKQQSNSQSSKPPSSHRVSRTCRIQVVLKGLRKTKMKKTTNLNRFDLKKYTDKEKREVAYITIQVEAHWHYSWKVEKMTHILLLLFFFADHSIHHHSKKFPTKIAKTWPTPKTSSNLVDCTTPTAPPFRWLRFIGRQVVALPRRCSFHPVCCDSGVDASASKRSNNKPNWMKPAVGWSTPRKTQKTNKWHLVSSSWPPIKTRKLRYPSAMQLPQKMEDEKFISGQPYMLPSYAKPRRW